MSSIFGRHRSDMCPYRSSPGSTPACEALLHDVSFLPLPFPVQYLQLFHPIRLHKDKKRVSELPFLFNEFTKER